MHRSSHDLRQPLHALGLFAAALAAKVREPELKSLVENINASVDALERLFSAMMDISKLDAGAVEPVRCSFPLAPLFARVDSAFAEVAATRGLRLRVVATQTWVDGDPLLLERSCSIWSRTLFDIPSAAVPSSACAAAEPFLRSRSAIPA
jgi:signal transduction histidine kinase